jgi:putative ABC transport system permease protein
MLRFCNVEQSNKTTFLALFFKTKMLSNYLKIALRSLLRQKGFSAINIIGLALGISVCALITLYVLDELSFDTFFANADRIYRIEGDVKFQGQQYNIAVVPDPLGPQMKREIPEVGEYTRFRVNGAWNFRNGNAVFREANVAYADSTFFRVFSLKVLQGSGEEALRTEHGIVITESLAKKYFGNENPIGKQLVGDNDKTYTVGAVMENLPKNVHLPFSVLIAMRDIGDSRQNNWLGNNFQTYILLKPGTNPNIIDEKLKTMVKTYIVPAFAKEVKTTYEEFLKAGNHYKYPLMPLTKIHLYSGAKIGELSPNGNIQYVWVFSAVAVCVLLIACVNFMNLATARASNRAKEVGIRKTLGSQRLQLVWQFLMESGIMVAAALVLAFCCIEIFLPSFNALSGKELSRSMIHTPFFAALFGALFLVVSLLAGMYPALVLSGYQPVKVLKGDKSSGSRNNTLRSTLVVVQFTASVALIIGTLIIYQQLNFIQTKQLGYKREQIVMVQDPDTRITETTHRYKQEVMRLAGVKNATVTNYLPTGGDRNNNLTFIGNQQENGQVTQQWRVDADFIPTFSMQIIKGRNFEAANISDSMNVVINETFANRLFAGQDPIGKFITTSNMSNNLKTFTVIGVVKDFHFESLRNNINPLILFFGHTMGATSVQFDASQTSSVLASLESTWKKLYPNKPFEYQFADDAFANAYRAEQRTGSILAVFTSVAILVACLGLFGLAAYTAEQRTKEIGIRKVLGASATSIIGLLSKDFLKLVGIAIVLATPLAYWGMGAWLQDFAYKTELSWWIFALSGAGAVGIAFMTVAGQALRAAQANPVQSLRSE